MFLSGVDGIRRSYTLSPPISIHVEVVGERHLTVEGLANLGQELLLGRAPHELVVEDEELRPRSGGDLSKLDARGV